MLHGSTRIDRSSAHSKAFNGAYATDLNQSVLGSGGN